MELQEEKQKLIQDLRQLEEQKQQIIIRLAEIQGVFRYLKEQEENKNKDKKEK